MGSPSYAGLNSSKSYNFNKSSGRNVGTKKYLVSEIASPTTNITSNNNSKISPAIIHTKSNTQIP